MTTKAGARPLRIPIRLVDGQWECALGGALPVKPGTEAELVVDRSAISDEKFLKALDSPVKHRVLGEDTKFLICLTIKPEARPKGELASLLKPYKPMRDVIASEHLENWNAATLCFFEVALSKPDPQQARRLGSEAGGLWLITQGLKTTAIESTTVLLPKPVSERPARSLNHALTILSETYETWRMSHTGNVYARVLYRAKDGRWYPLDILRDATLRDQQTAIEGELWDEFLRKMTNLRSKSG